MHNLAYFDYRKKKALNWSLSTFDWPTINNDKKWHIAHAGIPRWPAAVAYLKLKGENALSSKVFVGFAAVLPLIL